MHILVVDDKQPIIKKVTELLSQCGYTYETAINGLDAFEKAQSEVFDMYIIDHLMPVMNGIQLVKNLKSKDITSDTPILFMTTQDIHSLEAYDEYSHLDAIISKPLDQELFFNALNQLLPQNTVLHSL